MRDNLILFGVGGHNFVLLIWYFIKFKKIPNLFFLAPSDWPGPRTLKFYVYDVICRIISKTVHVDDVSFAVDSEHMADACINSYCTFYRTSNVDTSDFRFKSIERAYCAGVRQAYFFRSKFPITGDFYVYNGRWCQVAAFLHHLNISQYKSDLFYVESIFPSAGRRVFCSKVPPWDPSCRIKLADDLMEALPLNDDLKLKLIDDFFVSRKSGCDRDGKLFSTVSAASTKRNFDIVGFTSSMDEQIGLAPELTPESVGNVIDGFVDALCEFSSLGYSVCIRHHPNMLYSSNHDILIWNTRFKKLADHNVFVFGADADVSSYSLIESAPVIFSLGSTIGAEAVYSGRLVWDFNEYSVTRLSNVTRKYNANEVHNSLINGAMSRNLEPDELRSVFLRYVIAMTNIGDKFAI